MGMLNLIPFVYLQTNGFEIALIFHPPYPQASGTKPYEKNQTNCFNSASGAQCRQVSFRLSKKFGLPELPPNRNYCY